MEKYTFNPRIFINPPYIKCPKCNNATFGVLSVHDNFYLRRCKNCLHPRATEESVRIPLPTLKKKVIYIDQMAISNMMKVLNPETKSYKKGSVDEFWFLLFNKLDYLSKLQLIICPDSEFHEEESLLSPFYEPLKRIYELLSHGVSFNSYEVIERYQVYQHVKNWLKGEYGKKLELDINSVIRGKLNGWQDRLIISVDMRFDEKIIDDFRKNREVLHSGLSEVFKRWQTENDKDFYEWFQEEVDSFGRSTLGAHLNYLEKMRQYQGILNEESILASINPPPATQLMRTLHRVFENSGFDRSKILEKTDEYLHSQYIKDIPVVKIYSMILAAIARKAAAGQKNPPNQGMYNDICMISGLLPYCDAMFIDNACYNYLNEGPLVDEIDYDTKVFSQNKKEEFLEYLDTIESDASKSHLDRVYEVYGKDWAKPFTEIFK